MLNNFFVFFFYKKLLRFRMIINVSIYLFVLLNLYYNTFYNTFWRNKHLVLLH